MTLAASLNLAAASPASAHRHAKKPRLDHSGSSCVGMASFYHRKFSGRKMADGTRLDPNSDSAASRSLPLGTVARVTNLKDGKSALVTIRDRGPYAKGRIIDLSPGIAKQLGIIKVGAAKVEVTPLKIPQPDGSVATAADASADTSPAGPDGGSLGENATAGALPDDAIGSAM